MGSHIRSIDPWLPPWLLNQSAKEMPSRRRTDCMPPSGSNSARTMGEVPRARELDSLSTVDSCGVVKKALSPWKGAPILADPTLKRKSRFRTSPPALTNLWVCSLTSRFSSTPHLAIRLGWIGVGGKGRDRVEYEAQAPRRGG